MFSGMYSARLGLLSGMGVAMVTSCALDTESSMTKHNKTLHLNITQDLATRYPCPTTKWAFSCPASFPLTVLRQVQVSIRPLSFDSACIP